MILLAFIWGSSFILMKKGLVVFNDLEVAQLRMGIAWLSLLPFVWNKLFSIKKHIIPILIVGLFGNGFPAFLFTKAQTELDSSLIGILNALVPLFTFVLAMLLFKTKVKVSQLIGILLGTFWCCLAHCRWWFSIRKCQLFVVCYHCYPMLCYQFKYY